MSEYREVKPPQAVVSEPPPLSWDGLLSLGPILVVAVLGGIANFMRKMSQGNTRPYNIMELVGECVVSGFAGVLAYWCVHSWIGSPFLEAATVGICGHAGSRAIFLIENTLAKKAGIKPREDT